MGIIYNANIKRHGVLRHYIEPEYIHLTFENPTSNLDRSSNYRVKLESGLDTTVTVSARTVNVADISGQFVWDKGGPGEHTFTYVGEAIIRVINDRSYKIVWNGIGSQLFAVTKVSRGDNLPPEWLTPAGSIGTVKEGDTFSFQLRASDDSSAPTFSIVAGALPAGLTMNSSGLITGTASAVASSTVSTFGVRATDEDGSYVEQTFSLTVQYVDKGPLWFDNYSGANNTSYVLSKPTTAKAEGGDTINNVWYNSYNGSLNTTSDITIAQTTAKAEIDSETANNVWYNNYNGSLNTTSNIATPTSAKAEVDSETAWWNWDNTL